MGCSPLKVLDFHHSVKLISGINDRGQEGQWLPTKFLQPSFYVLVLLNIYVFALKPALPPNGKPSDFFYPRVDRTPLPQSPFQFV